MDAQAMSDEQAKYIEMIQNGTGIFSQLSKDTIAELLKFDVQQVSYGKLVKRIKEKEVIGQEKRTEMIEATICFRVDDNESNKAVAAGAFVPVLCIENPEAEEDQDQDQFINLVVSGDIKLVSYFDEEENIHALVIYYPATDQAHLLEFSDKDAKQNCSMMKVALCQFIYAFKTNKDPIDDNVTAD